MSLFDIAAGLSQFSGAGDDDRCVGHENAHGGSSLQPRSSTLCLLDETLQTLYDASHGSKRTAPAALFSSSTRVLGASKSSEELDQRLRDLTRTPPSSTRSPCHPAPSEKDALQRTASYSEADKAARTLLRQLSDEIDQLTDVLRSVGSDARVSSAARFLVEKYMDAQLNMLPATPFVQLVRKKALLKIQQFEQHCPASSCSTTHSFTDASPAAGPRTAAAGDATAPTVELWRRLETLTAPQHALLQRLAHEPDAQLAALPQTQPELARFARRYEQLRTMTARDIAQLPPHQQQIVRQLQQASLRS